MHLYLCAHVHSYAKKEDMPFCVNIEDMPLCVNIGRVAYVQA